MALSPTSSHGGGTFNGGTITDGLTIHPPVDTAALSVRANAATTFADLLALQNQTGAYVIEVDSSDDVTIDARNQGGTIACEAVGGYMSVGFGEARLAGRAGTQARVSAGGGDMTITDSGVKFTGSMGFFNHAVTAQPTGVAVTAAGIHAALVSLGLITA